MEDNQTCDSTCLGSGLCYKEKAVMRLPIWNSIGKTLFADEAVVLKVKVVIASCIGILDKTNDPLKKASGRRRSGN